MTKYDIGIIGGGAAGLSLAAGAAQMGAKIILFEPNQMGGDCLNYGCVPSKRLIALSKARYDNFANLPDKIHQAIMAIAPHDSPERFASLGVKVIAKQAKLLNKNQISVGDAVYSCHHIVIASGSVPKIPNIKGINAIKFYTNHNFFQISDKISRLCVVGGGYIACELGMAWQKLGAQVDIYCRSRLCSSLSPKAREVLIAQMHALGMNIYESTEFQEFSPINTEIKLQTNHGQSEYSHVLIACGRAPNVANFGCQEIGIAFDESGIKVNEFLQTSIKNIYAIGDCRGEPYATNKSGHDAGVVLRNILFSLAGFGKIKAGKPNLLPTCLFSVPEIAEIGDKMDKLPQDAKVFYQEIKTNDRAITESIHAPLTKNDGHIEIAVNKKGMVIAVSIVAPNAGDLLIPWLLMMNHKLPLKSMAGLLMPYPIFSELSKSVAGAFYRPLIFSKLMRCIVRILQIIKGNFS